MASRPSVMMTIIKILGLMIALRRPHIHTREEVLIRMELLIATIKHL